MNEIITQIVTEFLHNCQINFNTVSVEQEQENIFFVKIESEDSGAIIGSAGKNLAALSHVMQLFLIQRFPDSKVRVRLGVNDYLETKDAKFKQHILSKIQYVEKTGNDLKLPFYSAYERKKIHSIVGEYENDNIFTKSIGEGADRRLHICKKEATLSIDIDGLAI